MFSKKGDKKPEAAKAPGTTTTANPAPAPTPAAATDNAAQRQVNLRYIDQPDLAETFADSIGNLSFDGQSLRIEFTVTRMDEHKQGTPMTGRRYPACRLVLPPGAAVDLINRMQQVAAALTQAGVLRQNPPQPAAAAPQPTATASETRN
jgi:hypothetical protein